MLRPRRIDRRRKPLPAIELLQSRRRRQNSEDGLLFEGTALLSLVAFTIE